MSDWFMDKKLNKLVLSLKGDYPIYIGSCPFKIVRKVDNQWQFYHFAYQEWRNSWLSERDYLDLINAGKLEHI